MGKSIETSFLGHPKPLLSLSMTEVWERFSFYGIRPLLVLFMSATMAQGGLGIDIKTAGAIFGIFAGSLYLAALPGGWIADNYLGQKKAVFIGSIIIALGHLSIAFSAIYASMFFIGLCLIVIGTGLFKTCSSVMVGMLYKENDSRRDSGFTLFYMGINLGAFVSPIVCGLVQKEFGWHLGFGMGGLGMLIAIAIFYFKTIPDFKEFQKNVGMTKEWESPSIKRKNVGFVLLLLAILFVIFVALCLSGIINLNPKIIAENMAFLILACSLIYFLWLLFFAPLNKNERKNIIVFIILFLAAALFWSVFEQQPTTFNFFARDYTDRMIFGWEIPVPWFQSLNALFILILAPLFSMLWIFLAKRNMELSSIAKFGLGIFGGGLGFFVMFLAAKVALANNGESVSALWLTSSFIFLTLGELCLSPVGLSIMTKIAPNLIRNQVMGLWFVASSLGNVIAGLLGGEAGDMDLQSLPYLFLQCTFVLFAIGILLFLIRKPIYRMLNEEKN